MRTGRVAGAVLLALACAAAAPAAAGPLDGAAAPGARAALAAPSSGTMVAVRAAGALVIVALFMAATFAGYRWIMAGARPRRPGGRGLQGVRAWIARRLGADRASAARVEVLARSLLGPRESVCVIGVGGERFLLGVTSAQIRLLARLPEARAGEARSAARAAAGRGERPAREATPAPGERRGIAGPRGGVAPRAAAEPRATGERRAGAPGSAEPRATDFGRELASAVRAAGPPAAEPRLTGAGIRAALAASRERLARAAAAPEETRA